MNEILEKIKNKLQTNNLTTINRTKQSNRKTELYNISNQTENNWSNILDRFIKSFYRSDSTTKFIVICIIFLIFITINRYFSVKNILSFIPLTIAMAMIGIVIFEREQINENKLSQLADTVDIKKFPNILKYTEILNIINDIVYLSNYNRVSFDQALKYINSFLEIYNYVKQELQLNVETPDTYDIVKNGHLLYTQALNYLMSIIINIPPYATYINNIYIPRGILQNTEKKIENLQDIFITYQKHMINYINNLINKSINSRSTFSYADELIVQPNPLNTADYSPNWNLY